MLNSLTPEQIARFPEFVKKWTDIGLSCEPTDRPRAEAGIRLAYECAGLTPPKQIVWCHWTRKNESSKFATELTPHPGRER